MFLRSRGAGKRQTSPQSRRPEPRGRPRVSSQGASGILCPCLPRLSPLLTWPSVASVAVCSLPGLRLILNVNAMLLRAEHSPHIVT